MQITLDPSTMTKEQREHVAGFIVTFPYATAVDKLRVDVNLGASEPARLAAEQAEDLASPEVNPVAAFPLAVPPVSTTLAPFAHFTADAAASPTAPVDTPATSPVPNVPQPPAANIVASDTTAAAATGSPAPLDKAGLPWDARIHSSSKNVNADSTWRKKKGVDPQLVQTVEAELRALMTVPVAPVNGAVKTVTKEEAENPFASFQTHAVENAASSTVPTPPVAAAPSPTSDVDPKQLFTSLIGRAAAAIQGGKLTQAEATLCCSQHGVPALPLLAVRLDLVPQVAADIDAIIAARS